MAIIYATTDLLGLIPAARQLLQGGRLWKLTDRRFDEEQLDGGEEVGSGEAGAWVLDRRPEPHWVLWQGDRGSCDCDRGIAGELCVHIVALMLHLDESPTLPELAEQGWNGASVEDDLDPSQHLLFFVEPEPTERRRVTVLGPAGDVETGLRHPTKGSRPVGFAFSDLKKRQWRLAPAEVRVRDDGFVSLPHRQSSNSSAGSVKSVQSPSKAGTRILELLNKSAPLLDPKGREWSARFDTEVHIRFDALLSETGDEALYEPVVCLRSKTDSTEYSGGLIPADDTLLILDEIKHSIAISEEMGKALWLIRLMLSRPLLSARDIRARFSGNRPIPEGIQVSLPELPEDLMVLSPTLVLKIVDRSEGVDFQPGFRYGKTIVSPEAEGSIVTEDVPGTPAMGLRDPVAEKALIARAEAILSGVLCWERGHYAGLSGNRDLPLRLEMDMGEVLVNFGPLLMEAGMEIQLENRPLRFDGEMRLSANRGGSSLEMNAVVESLAGELDQLDLDSWLDRGLARTDEAYFLLSTKALDQLAFLRRHGMDAKGFLSTSPDNISLIDAVYSELQADESTAADLEKKRSAYLSLADFTPEGEGSPPDSFRATLRPYQWHGYAWLLHLRKLHLGGCLADDMGLGKTVQTLAYLCRLKADGDLGPSLLVGPVVTLGNWVAEIHRFAPEITVHRYSGPADRRFIPDKVSGIDLVVVSYQTLRNDAEKFLDRDWDHIVLDEAHYVKNAASRTFKTVRSLRAQHRLSLTGTPLENHLGELWSQMSFLNPGLLGSRSNFERLYARPAERDGDEVALERLSGIVAPFLLRRRKADVLDDLPPKDETILRCDMTDDQAEAYKATSELYYRQVTGLLSDDGLDGARIQIFTILSKLRLLAIHPPLAGEQFAGVSSGKMLALDTLLDEILDEDHKVLVFSQFLGALDRAEQTCRSRRWEFSRLTGSTGDREKPISRFRDNPSVRVFLLSLRAGGVGINLTEADYVVLLDPWWNPAVEAQAVDRAHRMGQTRPVMAYRLITAGTIEEKVLELQEKKKGLVAGALGEGGMPDLNEEDILAFFRAES